MKCDDVRERIASLVLDVLDSEEEHAMEDHFDRCPPCRARFELETSAVSLLRTAEGPSASPLRRDRAVNAMKEVHSRSGRVPWVRRVTVAAAVMACLVFGGLLLVRGIGVQVLMVAESVEGRVRLLRHEAGTWEPLKERSRLGHGDRILTEGEGSALFKLTDDGKDIGSIRVLPGSSFRFSVDPAGPDRCLHLERGEIHFDLSSSRGVTRVSAPEGEEWIVREGRCEVGFRETATAVADFNEKPVFRPKDADIICERAPLEDACVLLSARTGVRFVFDLPETGKRRITFYGRGTDPDLLEAFLEWLDSAGFETERTNGEVRIGASPPAARESVRRLAGRVISGTSLLRCEGGELFLKDGQTGTVDGDGFPR